ncbi:hypothetical protein [Streptomyces sp. NBC_01089]|uniref:hypothetical protein n=1 Tax=Streptomyces sp. NBC_01089 TaxID=2903747 RepID=UPI003864BA31|nr:hypothetical protein OG510_22795 [Streptomyces sp. NBC_01089]
MGMKDQFKDKAEQLAQQGKQSMGDEKEKGRAPERSSRPEDEAKERGQGAADRVRDQFDS